jgi:drug/metabolite transporter (DMT)-like permease
VAALEPVYGVVLATAFLQAWPTLRTVAGGALIVTAALLASKGSGVGAPSAVSVASKAGDTPP